ncbi:MAG: aminopeptidase P N-terminal domain-containing protein [Gammaproteobacteria bacterium]|jgi:Xaa-Pro aminopeptidase|nr:Xaa-Pro aminopeptidase [Gammaproteobacteria bacterium]MBQ09623.1 Xaa-Pro aminopeptidase [Gammaproteobacteria bacterium]MDP6146949.1 aminopeptidase P N-terminal domain-containing protein [Gammaproteobacteria bacterium]HJL80604.1 aminopeptidase P N-terminal domain-containing protein [Gammaproteobacteria bacterium]HJM09635.1 aminopeptidase P N-terminal domain-containing protein [Gammaproteobacteria bacterium]|tara:strand:+ start:38431 stop:39738 length:1308 start_codon:yes stop_codon:yes gene_type:complete
MKKEFEKRRRSLAKLIGKNGIAVIPTSNTRARSRDTDYPYRPDSDFYYFTGFSEPDAVMILAPGREDGAFVVCLRSKNPLTEIWDGHMEGLNGIKKNHGADQSFKIADLETILASLFMGRQKVLFTLGQDDVLDKILMKSFNAVRAGQRRGGVVPSEIQALEPLIHEMRLIKSKHEISLMKRAAKISVDAHKRVFKNCKPGVFEYQIEADIIHEFGKNGTVPAYTSIVASGVNACTLHYISNREKMKAGQLLLTDAGCEHEMYAADITRTIPVSGVYSKEQKEIYELVLRIQKTAIDSVRPGQTFEGLQSEAIKGLTQGLKKLGLLKGRIDQLIKSEAYKDFYMHGIGHWLGMDVHDVGSYMDEKGNSRRFQSGMVLTIEPGIYISKKNKNVSAEYRGIGIRIEDDVLVTKSGCDVLTKSLPKEIDQIESIMARN